jgi:hypothetical protein
LGLVNWTGTFGGVSYIEGVGGGLFGFELVSECKCSKRVRIQGLVLAGAVGYGVKAVSGSAGSSEWYDYNSCPDPNVADGLASIGNFGVVTGFGFNCSNNMKLGGLHSQSGCSGPAWGFDLSVGVYIGASKVVRATEECCKE